MKPESNTSPEKKNINRFVREIFKAGPGELTDEQAARLMERCADEGLADAESRQRFPELWRFFEIYPDVRREYDVLMELARAHAAGEVPFVRNIPPHPGQKPVSYLQKLASSARRLPNFLAQPVGAAAGVRGSADSGQSEKTFFVSELNARITLALSGPEGEVFGLNGRVVLNDLPYENAQVTIRAKNAWPRPRKTDPQGFFQYRRLRAGSYQLKVKLEQGMLIIPEVIVRDD